MKQTINIAPYARAEPPPIEQLAASAEDEGYGFVRATIDDWVTGQNRFQGPSEVFFLARSGVKVVGMCGLNRDPYFEDPSFGRIRHLYVSPDYRRLGVARSLVDEVIRAALGCFETLQLRTRDAAEFYEALGFRAVVDPCVTHVMALDRRG